MFELLFWISSLILAFTYLGYPIVIALAAPFRRRPVIAEGKFEPAVTLVVPVRNESHNIEAKIRNCGELDYPREKTQILIVDDGSEDGTVELARKAFDAHLRSENGKGGTYGELRVLELGGNLGKAAALNRGCEEAEGEILLFSDADCRIAPDAVRLLVRHFVNPIVGCVGGRYVAGGLAGRNAGGVGLYWRYEDFLRRKESDFGGILGASGALYAVRRELYNPLDSRLINDDFVVPMTVSLQGYRTLYEPRAEAVEDESRNEEVEFSRRVRIMAGNCQHLWLFRGLLNGSRQRLRPLFQMFCHKLLRVASPFWLAALLFSNAALVFSAAEAGGASSVAPFWVYQGALAAQVVFYGLACAGYFLKGGHNLSRFATLPYYFTMLNVAAVLGVFYFVFSRSSLSWGRNTGR